MDLGGEETGNVGNVPTEVRLQGRNGSFVIDAFEASLSDGRAQSRSGVVPAHGLTWYEGDAACRASGKRLCTEEEWLIACTGQIPVDENQNDIFSDDRLLGRSYPYGAYQQSTWCASSRAKDDPRPLITGNHPRCVTPEGVYDLEGLTKEWVGVIPSRAALKGGSYYSGSSARCGYLKDSEAPDHSDGSIGFRCCSGALDEYADLFSGGKVGDQLLSFSGNTLDGTAVRSSDFAGSPLIITFWASWCGPCRAELPALDEMYRKHRDRGLKVLAVNVDTEAGAAKRFLAQTPVSFPIFMDRESSLMNRFDTRGVPTTFWVEPSGRIRQRTVGFDKGAMAKLEADVSALMTAD
ncbi:MAG: redoxin domain-containing protein [Proteobacteria bacterium]|nr:redoxin domain-containing protein [Pseudomonadota bacterium]